MVQLRERKTYSLGGFLGVDYSNSPQNVAKQHAVEMSNFIWKNGINRKRNGWAQIADFEKQKINGFWSFTDEQNNEHVIVHAGTKIYKVQFADMSLNVIKTDITPSGVEINNMRSFGMAFDNKLYLLCGDYLVYGDFGSGYVLQTVSTVAYKPTTAIGIEADGVGNKTIKSYEQFNLLTLWHKNTMAGIQTTDAAVKYTLDANIVDSSVVTMVLNTYTISETVKQPTMREFTNSGTDKTVLYDKDTVVGSINFLKGVITINQGQTIEPIEVEASLPDNITVTFASGVDNSKKIRGCTFGTLFGVGGVGDRLFVAGNNEHKNIDFFSNPKDFTYFGDMNTCAYGNPQNPIVAYSKIGDSVLAIHKNDNVNESTIYYRSMTVDTTEEIKDDLDRVLSPIKAGAVGVGVICPYGNVNFNSDNLIVSESGIYAVGYLENTTTDTRYAKSRDKLINPKIIEYGNLLKDGFAFVYKNNYYFSIGDTVYVADSRFKNSVEQTDTYGYEFWVLKNVPAYIFAVYNNELIFGTKSGKICRFTKTFIDSDYQDLHVGDITFADDSTFVINNSLYEYLHNLQNGDRIKLYSQDSGLNLAEWFNKDNILSIDTTKNTITLKSDVANCNEIIDSKRLYFENGDNGMIGNIDYVAKTFQLFDNGVVLSLINHKTPETFYVNTKEEQFEIANVETDGNNTVFNVKFMNSDSVVKFVKFNNIIGYFNYIRPVIAEFQTAVSDFGTNLYGKKLQSLTISTAVEVSSQMTLSIKTRELDKPFIPRGSKLYTFNDFSFINLSFITSDFSNSYTIYKPSVRDFNYIMFRYFSENDGDCAVENITAVYTTINKNRGVK